MNALKLAAGRGVDVRIITPHIPDKEDFVETLSVSQQITEKEAKLKLWFKLPAEVLKIFTLLL